MANLLSNTTVGGSSVITVGNIGSYALTSVPANVITTSGGQTIAGTTYFSGGESINLYGVRGRFTNEYIHLYNKVGIGHPSGWGQGEGNTPTYGLSTYGGMNIAYGNGASSTLNGYVRINQNWAGGDYGAEALTIRGTYPSITLRSTTHNSKWLIHNDDTLSFYYGVAVDDNSWSRRFFIPTDGNIWMSWAGDYLSNLLDAKQNVGQVSGVSISGSEATALKTTLGVTGLPYSCDITVNGDANTYYPVHFMYGDQDVWRRIIIKRGYSETAPWDPIGTGVHHGGLLLDWEGNFGGWGGADYSDRLRVFQESYTNICADMYIYTHSMGYVFMLRGGGAVYHIFSDQEIRGGGQVGTPDIAYSASTKFYENLAYPQYDIYAPAPVTSINSSRIDGLRTKKQSQFDGRYQLSSTAINTSNIGSQSVNYATSAGNSNTTSQTTFSSLTVSNNSAFSGQSTWFGGYGPGYGSGIALENLTTFARFAFWGLDFYDWNDGIMMTINNGYVSATNSFRAPIFYDSNDTNYYVDPNGTSRVFALNVVSTLNTGNVIMLGYNIDGSVSTSEFRGINFHNTSDFNYYIGKPAGAWTQPLDIHFYTGIRLKSHGSYGGTSFINLSSGNTLMTVGDGTDYVKVTERLQVSTTMNLNYDQLWTSSGNLHLQYSGSGNIDMNYGGGYTFSRTSLRAPIFYDLDDTNYYVDPNSESKLRKLWINNGGASGVSWSTGLNMGDGSNYWNLIQDGGIARQRNFGAGGYDWFNNTASTQIMLLSNAGNLNVSGTITASGGNSTNWNTAYGWGNHAGLYLGINAKAADSNLLDGIDSSSFVRSDADDTITGTLTISGSSPQLKFSDGDASADDFWIHVNSNRFYILPDRDDNGSWDTPYAFILDNNTSTAEIYGYTAATQSWVTSQGYLTSSSLSGYATQTYVNTAVANLVDSAPGTLDTLNELAAALGDDPNFATTVTNSIAGKLSLSGGTLTGELVAGAGISGLTLANGGISGSNYNITGVNQLEIADPGEGIVFKTGSSGDMTLAIVDDSSDNILRFSGTGAVLQVNTNTVIHSGTIGSQSVNYASSAGNADTVDGKHATNNANNLAVYESNGYLYIPSWMNVNGGGIFAQTNNAHLRPNTGAYGAWEMIGSKNGWSGIYFNDSGDYLMANNNEVGHYQNGVGWKFRWYQGEMYISSGTTGGGTERTVIHSGNIGSQSVNYASSAGSVAWTNVSSRPTALSQFTNDLGNYGGWLTTSGKAADSELIDGIDSSRIVYGDGASKVTTQSDANSQVNSGFYENGGGGSNWPTQTWYNSINVRHSNQSNYHGFQIAMSYYDNNLWFRSYQGSGTFQSWAYVISSQNIGSQSVSYATTAGTANAVTWANVSGKPSTFTPSSHTHAISEVTGLQTALDGKQAAGSYLTTSGKAADSNLLDGLDLHTGRNNEANKVVRTDVNGYIQAGWINTTSGNTTNTLTDIYVNTNDGYIRKATPAHFRSQITDGVYAPVSHTHTIANVTGLQTALDGKQAAGSYAAASHDHDKIFLTDSRGASRAPSYYDDRYAQWDFQNTSDTGAGGDGWHGLLTVSKWTVWDASHRQEQIAFTGDDLKRRTATSDSAWGSWKTILDSSNYSSYAQPAASAINTSNIGSQSVSYASSAGSASSATTATNFDNSKVFSGSDFLQWRRTGGGHDMTILHSGATGAFDFRTELKFRNQDGVEFIRMIDLDYWTAKMTFNIDMYNNNNGLGTDGGDCALAVDADWHSAAIRHSGIIQAVSDRREKNQILPITDAVNKVKGITGSTYYRNNNTNRFAGVIAQDVKEVLPEAVWGSEDTRYSVDYNALIALLIEATKEQQKTIEELTQRIQLLENK